MSIEFKIGAAPMSWRQMLDGIARAAGVKLVSIQANLDPGRYELLIRNPETGHNLSVVFGAFDIDENHLIQCIQERVDEDNATSAVRRVSVKAGTLAEKAATLAAMAKTLSEMALELDSLVERKKS